MTPQEKIKNNEFLLNLDMKDASREQRISWLCQIIKNETDKPEDQRDFELIAECTEYLQELSEPDAEPTQEQMDRVLLEIKVNHPASKEIEMPVAKRPRKLLKIMAAAAAILVMLFSALTVTAKIQGYGNAFDYVMESIRDLLNIGAGDSIERTGVTLIKGDKNIFYESVEDLLITEDYDILYPEELPNNIEITRIVQQVINENYTVYSYQFNDLKLSITASTVRSVTTDDLQSHDIYETSSGIAFYIKAFSNGTYQAISFDEKYEYRIIYNDYELLKTILNNMKGIEK